MNNLSLKVQSRQEVGKKIKNMRTQGKIPAVLYGHGVKNVNLTLSKSEFEKIFKKAGESSLIDLVIDDDKPVKVLIHDVQHNALTDGYIHVDFRQVNMDEKITAKIGLKFIGESTAVKELGGVLVTQLSEIEVSCLPQYLVHEFEINISPLKAFNDAIFVKDLKIASEIKILNNPEDIIVSVIAPRTDKELEELSEKPKEAVGEVEVVGKEKKAEEPEAGAAPVAEEKKKA